MESVWVKLYILLVRNSFIFPEYLCVARGCTNDSEKSAQLPHFLHTRNFFELKFRSILYL